ncbi:MAG: LCP family protein [bacterium]
MPHPQPKKPISAAFQLIDELAADQKSDEEPNQIMPQNQSPQPDFVYDPLHDKRHNLNKFKPPRKKRPWWKKLLMGLALIAVAIGVWFAFFTVKNIIKVAPNFFKFDQKLKGEDVGRVNILLLGVGDPGHDGEGLSDTNILLSVNTRNNKVALTSIPRDTRVKIPGYGFSKINAANAYGDVPLAKQVVEDFLGQPINYYVKTNFTGLKQAVDSVGGIQIVNKDYLSDSEFPCDKNQWKSCGFTLKPGTYQADGSLALKYARCRKGTCGDDFGRAARQQEVISSIRSKALSAGTILNPAKLTSLIQTAGDNVKTDMSVGELLRLNDITKDVPSDQVVNAVLSISPNGFLKSAPDGTSDLVPIDNTLVAIHAFVDNIFTFGPIWKENATIAIQNGTATTGIGGKLELKINKDKYPITIASVSNALKKDYQTTQLIDYTLPPTSPSPSSSTKKSSTPTDSPTNKLNTRSYLEGLLKVKASPPVSGAYSPTDFVIIIGNDYTNYLPATSVSPATR